MLASPSRSPKPARSPASTSKVSSSPLKPRLIWRGSLQLTDGTLLPGVAFVSSVQPDFSSSSSKAQHAGGGTPLFSSAKAPLETDEAGPSTQRLAPLTLSKSKQDSLSLSIEMLRHAPINIVETIEDVDRDDQGTLLKPRRIVSKVPKENSSLYQVSYEAGGDLRVYVDPRYPSTVSYMERMFCYEEEDEEEQDLGERAEGSSGINKPMNPSYKHLEGIQRSKGEAFNTSSNVLVLSLDKSYRYSLQAPSSDNEEDVFSSDTSQTAWNDTRTLSTETIEAVLIGVKSQTEKRKCLEMHVGQKIVRRVTTAMTAEGLDGQKSAQGMRPGDPAPRGLSRVLSAKYRSLPTTQAHPNKISRTSSSSSFVPPLPPTSRSNSTSKRPNISTIQPMSHDPRSTSLPVLKREASSPSTDFPASSAASPSDSITNPSKKRSKTIHGDSTYSNTIDHSSSNSNSSSTHKVEEKNRSLIKKLVHHQLLGKGLEKNDANYLACFNPTCHGTLLAFRHQLNRKPLGKAEAATIIERHLDMYL